MSTQTQLQEMLDKRAKDKLLARLTKFRTLLHNEYNDVF